LQFEWPGFWLSLFYAFTKNPVFSSKSQILQKNVVFSAVLFSEKIDLLIII